MGNYIDTRINNEINGYIVKDLGDAENAFLTNDPSELFMKVCHRECKNDKCITISEREPNSMQDEKYVIRLCKNSCSKCTSFFNSLTNPLPLLLEIYSRINALEKNQYKYLYKYEQNSSSK